MSNQNAKLMRWSFELQRHTLDVRHRPGKLNLLPDLLSRPSSAQPQSLIFADVAHILCDSHLQVVEPRLPIRAKTLLCVVAGGKSVHRATPSCASTRPRGGTHVLRGEVCYVYSLPLCYFTQSALPIYQTGCCSVHYTCDLSRVTDFARCRLFAQLGHTLELAQVTDDIGHLAESTSLLTADRSYQLMIELYRSGVKLPCKRV